MIKEQKEQYVWDRMKKRRGSAHSIKLYFQIRSQSNWYLDSINTYFILKIHKLKLIFSLGTHANY